MIQITLREVLVMLAIAAMAAIGIYYTVNQPQNFKVESTTDVIAAGNTPAFVQSEVERICTRYRSASLQSGLLADLDPAMIEAVSAGLVACKAARGNATLRVSDFEAGSPSSYHGVMILIELARSTGLVLETGHQLPINEHGLPIVAACIPLKREDGRHGAPAGTQMALLSRNGRGYATRYCRLPSKDELATLVAIGSG